MPCTTEQNSWEDRAAGLDGVESITEHPCCCRTACHAFPEHLDVYGHGNTCCTGMQSWSLYTVIIRSRSSGAYRQLGQGAVLEDVVELLARREAEAGECDRRDGVGRCWSGGHLHVWYLRMHSMLLGRSRALCRESIHWMCSGSCVHAGDNALLRA